MYKKCEEILNKLQYEGKIIISDYEFPLKQELKLRLKDILEDEVDEKYYINDGILNKIISDNQAGYLSGGKWDKINESCRRYYKEDGISPTIHTCQGGNTEPKIVTTICLNSKSGRNGIEGLQPSLKDRIYDSNGIATCCATSNFFMPNYTDGLRIRKLTPKECWRLMGFDDEDFEKASKVNSNTQLYKQAGNSIVVNVLEAILRNLLLEDKQDIPKGQMNIYDYLSI